MKNEKDFGKKKIINYNQNINNDHQITNKNLTNIKYLKIKLRHDPQVIGSVLLLKFEGKIKKASPKP